MMATIEAPDQDGGVDPAFVVLSLPEVAALALRAARGAGLTWGMAEECGNAAVWLAAHGLDWSIDILARLTGEGGARIVPAATKWTSKGAVCGLHAGATLADFATLPEGPGTNGVRIGLVNHPLCLLPFAARAAKAMQSSLDVMLDDNLWASFDKIGRVYADAKLGHIAIGLIDIRPAAKAPSFSALLNVQSGAVSAAAYASLETIALNMTVPATAQSQAGAGAARSDND
ncbi:MAG: hypothetical protein ACJASV_001611 [Pseudorhodobacter sp.]|jgi:hypothetical protein